MVHSLDDANGMGDDGVGASRPQVVGGEAFQNLVREPVGCGERELQGVGVGNAGSIQVGRLELSFFSQGLDLGRCAVNEDDSYVERAQDGDVQQDIGKILAGNDGAIHAQEKSLFPKLRYVLKDAPQVGEFHVSSSLCFQWRNRYSVCRGIQINN